MPRSVLNWVIAAAGLGVIALGVVLRPAITEGPCTVVQPPVSLPDLPEASGLAVSRRHPGILWSHNDSGNSTTLFAVDSAGALRARVRVPVATRDWEDISAARCPAGDCLYLADIGDNRLARTRLHVYRIPEPRLDARETAAPEVFTATYPDGAHNAEALFVVDDAVFVITRDRASAVYRAPLPAGAGGDLSLRRVGQLALASITDAETSPDGAWIVARTAKAVLLYAPADLTRGGTLRETWRISIEGLKEPQGEGVALDRDGMLYLVSEGRAWSRAGRFISLRCAF